MWFESAGLKEIQQRKKKRHSLTQTCPEILSRHVTCGDTAWRVLFSDHYVLIAIYWEVVQWLLARHSVVARRKRLKRHHFKTCFSDLTRYAAICCRCALGSFKGGSCPRASLFHSSYVLLVAKDYNDIMSCGHGMRSRYRGFFAQKLNFWFHFPPCPKHKRKACKLLLPDLQILE